MRVLSSFTENLSLKLFSLAVSVMLFLFVSVESATPVDVDFRVEYRTADDIMIVGEAPALVHATLRGPWATFRRYEPNELKPVVIGLTDAGPGTVRHQVDTADIIAPGGMTVVAVRPSELQLLLDRKTERRVPVQVDLVGRPAFGYELESVTPKPRELRVIGPAREMQSLDFVFTRPVDVEGRQADFTAEVDAKAPPPPLRLKDKKVAVAVRVVEETTSRSRSTTRPRARAPSPSASRWCSRARAASSIRSIPRRSCPMLTRSPSSTAACRSSRRPWTSAADPSGRSGSGRRRPSR
jgi:YbbR domain-containing protein